jgi:hypothetical protein
VIIYIENTKESTESLLALIIEFNKVAGCKISIQKSAFISVHFKWTTWTLKLNNLGINLTKGVWDVFLKIAKHCWEKLKIWVTEKTSNVHGSEDLVFLRW